MEDRRSPRSGRSDAIVSGQRSESAGDEGRRPDLDEVLAEGLLTRGCGINLFLRRR